MKKHFAVCLFLAFFSFLGVNSSYAQEEGITTYDYAYVHISGLAGKKLNVKIDLGGEEKEIQSAKHFQKALKKSRSYVHILEFMQEKGYQPTGKGNDFKFISDSKGVVGLTYFLRKPIVEDSKDELPQAEPVAETTETEVTTEVREEMEVDPELEVEIVTESTDADKKEESIEPSSSTRGTGE